MNIAGVWPVKPAPVNDASLDWRRGRVNRVKMLKRVRNLVRRLTLGMLLAGGALLAYPAAAQLQAPIDPRFLPQGSPIPGTGDPRPQQQTAGQAATVTVPTIDPTGGVETLHPDVIVDTDRETLAVDRLLQAQREQIQRELIAKAPPKPGEFERYVERVIGRKLPRFGSDLLLPEARDFATPAEATVPPDYVLNPGDVVSIAMAGSVEGSVEREIDANGNIFLPKIGTIHLAGVRNADLHDRDVGNDLLRAFHEVALADVNERDGERGGRRHIVAPRLAHDAP